MELESSDADVRHTVPTWAEDTATQGCDRSADPSGRNGGAAKSRPKENGHSGAKAVNPRGLGTESPKSNKDGDPFRAYPLDPWVPAVAAAFVRQLRGPHLRTCP
jgi:hypothetical protein